MTREEIQIFIETIEKKKTNKEKLEDYETCILDIAKEAKKNGRQITEEQIEYTKFMVG